MNYLINFNAFITYILPPFLRKRKQIAWLMVILSPARYIHLNLLYFRRYSLWRATINGQVNRLRQALRQHFNNNQIQILHPSNNLQQIYIYQINEVQPVVYIYNRSELRPPVYVYQMSEPFAQFDFIVTIPLSLVPTAPAIFSFVNQFKPAGRRFAIFSPTYPSGTRVLP